MRIGTYNVYGFQGFPSEDAAQALGEMTSPERTSHFAKAFASLGCDILALQEGAAPPQMLKQIAKELGTYLSTVPSPGNWPGQIFSRFPIVETRILSHFTHHEPTPPLSRCAGAAKLAIDGSRHLWLFVIHLHPSDQSLRVREAEMIDAQLTHLLKDTDEIVVLGDFNCPVGEEVHSRLENRGFTNAVAKFADGGLRPTMDTFREKPPITIDHIYVSPTLVSRVRSARVVTDAGFSHEGPHQPGLWVHSDHLPVIVDLE